MNHETGHLREPQETEALINVAKYQRKTGFQMVYFMSCHLK